MMNRMEISGRRDFLQMMGVGLAGLALSNRNLLSAAAKPLRGLFPIAFTPMTPDNKMDLEGMASQVKFCIRGGGAAAPGSRYQRSDGGSGREVPRRAWPFQDTRRSEESARRRRRETGRAQKSCCLLSFKKPASTPTVAAASRERSKFCRNSQSRPSGWGC